MADWKERMTLDRVLCDHLEKNLDDLRLMLSRRNHSRAIDCINHIRNNLELLEKALD